MKNENIKLLANAITKKIPDTTRTLVVVRVCSKSTPIVIAKVVARKTKLPTLNNILFSLS
ncbi:MAG: hypothetical protein ACKVKZ_07110 [Alphaproteobacteria bacterium]